MARSTALLKDPAGAVPTALALGYAVNGYAGGFAMMMQPSWVVSLLGTLLTAHAMLVAAYLLHDASHDAVFRKHAHNRVVGEVMSFIAGSSYASYERIRHLHLRHHRERIDVSCFDHRAFLRERPAWVVRAVLALEWLYVPAVETVMHLQVIVRPFFVASQRGYLPRVLGVLGLRLTALTAVAVVAPRALLLYAIAYALLVTTLGFFDAFQHTYDFYVDGVTDPPSRELRPRSYETVNTFSNVVSTNSRWLDLLALNFGFHNAHHERTGAPWYRLPELHRELFRESAQVLPVGELLRTFHANRVRRVFDDAYGGVGTGPGRADGFVGAHGVSFLSVV